MRVLLVVVLVVSVAWPARSDQARPALAVLPITGEGVQLSDLPVLERVERAAHAEIASIGGFAVQPRRTTAAHVAGARELGIACSVDDASCLAKMALVAEATWLLVPVATRAPSGVTLSLRLIDAVRAVEVGRADTTGPVDPARAEEEVRALVRAVAQGRRTQGRPGQGVRMPSAASPGRSSPLSSSTPPTPSAPPSSVAATTSTSAPTASADSQTGSTASSDEARRAGPGANGGGALGPRPVWLWGGATALGVGGLAAVVGSVGASLVEAELASARPIAEQEAWRTGGLGLIVLASGGAVVALLGAGLLAMAFVE